MNRTTILVAITASALLLSACGFRPIYAAPNGGAPVSRLVSVGQIAAPEVVAPYVSDALSRRLAVVDGATPQYRLDIEVREVAEQLAVQIDATVTRYNYRLDARYWVTDGKTGERFGGQARAVTSYNIVSSQYSTLFAERTAIEKAARLLAEEVERDLLIRFAETPEERRKMTPESFESEPAPSELLADPRRGETVEPIVIINQAGNDPIEDPASATDED
jgi:LPS-assembly lipoprotein